MGNSFVTLPHVPSGASGAQSMVDLFSEAPPSGLSNQLTVVCTGDFTGDISLQGSTNGTSWSLLCQFDGGGSAGGGMFEPLVVEAAVRYLRVFVAAVPSSDGVAISVAGEVSYDSVGTVSVADVATLQATDAKTMSEGTSVYVRTLKAFFDLMSSTVSPKTLLNVAALNKAGYQWVRRVVNNPVWEAQPTWVIDPTNSTGLASDENTGFDSTHPLLTYAEHTRRLAFAFLTQTAVTVLGDQQSTDLPTYSYYPHGQASVTFSGVPSVLYTSTVTNYVAAAYMTLANTDDNQFFDTNVPGGSFTAAGATGKGVLIKRVNGTEIYAPVLTQLNSTSCRVGQPINLASGISLASFAVGDTYELIKLPKISFMVLPLAGNLSTKLSFFDWNVSATVVNGTPSTWFAACYMEKLPRSAGLNLFFQGCCFDSGGGSFEGGSPTSFGFQQCSFKGTGATQYFCTGTINAENTPTSVQGSTIFVENGIWNGGQISGFDCTNSVFTTGTGGRGHFIGAICGKNNTSKLVTAASGSLILSQNVPVTNGNFFNLGSTSDPNPIKAGSTTSNTQILLQPDGNGVFMTTT